METSMNYIQPIDIGESILGAGESISMTINLDLASEHYYVNDPKSLQIGLFSTLADKRLRLRCLAYIPSVEIDTDNIERKEFFTKMQRSGWEVRVTEIQPLRNSVIIDKSAIIIGRGSFLGQDTILLGESYEASLFRNHFEALWNTYENKVGKKGEILYENVFGEGSPNFTQTLAQISSHQWDDILKNLSSNPKEIFALSPRKFEEMIAELLFRDGFMVTLTPKIKDGGRDVIAVRDTSLGRHLYLVECKRYSPSNPVGVSLVRALYGVVQHEQATAGLLVTTSTFTKEALKFREDIRFRLSYKDYHQLAQWIRNAV